MDSTFWDNRYLQEFDLYGNEPNHYFKEKLAQLKPGNLLIPGEGEGRQAIHAALQGWRVTAFDMSKVGREHALQKAERQGISLDYQLSNAEDFIFEAENFDCAALIYFHLPPALRGEIHKKIGVSVKPGGYLILEGFHPKQLTLSSGGPKDEAMLYTSAMLHKDFEGWDFIEDVEQEVLLREGSGHAGPGYVTRLFARKRL